MKRFLIPALLAMSLVSLSAFAAILPPAPVAKKPAPSATRQASGTIVSTSETSVVIKTSKGKEMTFALNDKTAKPSELKEGEMIRIQYMTENGNNMATKISMTSARSKPKK